MISFVTAISPLRRSSLLSWLMLQSMFMASSLQAAEIANSGLVAQLPPLAMNSRPVSSQLPSTTTTSSSKTITASKSKVAKRLANKAMTPLRVTAIQLGRPLEWLNSARHHIWPSAFVIPKSTYYIESMDSPRLLDVAVTPRSMFSLGGSTPVQTTRLDYLGEYDLPKNHELIASNHASATELQLRMADDWSMLYVLDRSNTDLDSYTVSVGLGLRHSF